MQQPLDLQTEKMLTAKQLRRGFMDSLKYAKFELFIDGEFCGGFNELNDVKKRLFEDSHGVDVGWSLFYITNYHMSGALRNHTGGDEYAVQETFNEAVYIYALDLI